MVMDNAKEVPQALFIGIAVASVLLYTYRYSKAIELFSECLVLLKRYSPKLEKETLSKLYALVYQRLFNLYCLVGDYKNAVYWGEEGFHVCSEIGDVGSAAVLADKIGDLYQSTGEQGKAKEKYEEALALYSSELMTFNLFGAPVIKRREHLNKMLVVATKTGDKKREGGLLNQLGELSLSLFEYPEAKDYFLKELAISQETGNRKEEGRALGCLGYLYKTTEEYQQAKKYYEQAVAILEEIGEMKKLGEACSELGRVCNSLREFQKAKALQQKALEISVKSGDKGGEISYNRHLGGVHMSLGEYDEAKECYKMALTKSKDIDDRKAEAYTCSDLGVLYRELNDFKKAENYCKKAREIYKETGDLEYEGSENRELGDLYRFLGKYEEARICFERVLAITKQIGDRRGEGDANCFLGGLYQSIGDYGKARECHEQALAISIETNHPRGQGVDYGNLGTVCQHLGDYDTAYKYYKKALEINIRTGHSEGIAAAYDYLGVVCQHLGEYVKAENFCQKALATAKEIGDRRKEANILSNLANIQTSVGEPEKAKAFYEEALQISKEVGDIKQEAVMSSNLGTVYQSLGDMTKSKKFLEKSLAITKRIGSKDGEGSALGSLGVLNASLGEYAKARKCYEQALEIARQTADKKGEMTMNSSLGSLHLSQNELQKALEFFKTALQICEQMGDVHGKSMSYCQIAGVYLVSQDIPKALSYLSASIKNLEEMRISIGESEHFKMGFADKNDAPYRLMVTVLLKLKCVKTALSISELARARSLAEVMATQYSCQRLPGFDTNRLFDFTNVIKNKSCTCLSFCFVHENLFCWILKAGGVEGASRKGLTAEIRPQGASIQDWLENLANQSYRKFLLLQGERCEDRSLFLWDKYTEARSPSKPEEGVTTSLVTDQEEEEEQKEPQALKNLYSAIIAPVLKFLKGSEIIIVPDRSLYRIPFAALMGESGNYLSEKFRIRFIPSLTTLKLIQDSPANYHSQTGVLIVGDPEVGLPELCPPLPCAREEAEMIGRLLHVRPLTGKQATKQAVLQKIHSVSLIHIAAHGNADRGDIALAPAQHIKGKPKKEDFVLTMSDISKVQLRAKLVVLSCCHSGLGQIKAEGVVGIARAFLGSGARSVLVSLWAVDDSATMQFMKQFYGHLVRGKSAGESLHETMKWMRGSPQYCEVRKWAPFMLIGDDVSFKFKK
ncbi:hypothetical protein ACROYT_G000738 [Oculina patagonica]